MDDKQTGINTLYWQLYTFIIKNEGKGIVEFDIDDDSDYEHYIQLLNITIKAFNDRREELVHAKFGISYRDILNDPYGPHAREVREYLARVCPMNIVEWTNVEKEIVNSIRASKK